MSNPSEEMGQRRARDVATRRLLLEASLQIPVLSRASEFQLRSKWNLLVGLRWLF